MQNLLKPNTEAENWTICNHLCKSHIKKTGVSMSAHFQTWLEPETMHEEEHFYLVEELKKRRFGDYSLPPKVTSTLARHLHNHIIRSFCICLHFAHTNWFHFPLDLMLWKNKTSIQLHVDGELLWQDRTNSGLWTVTHYTGSKGQSKEQNPDSSQNIYEKQTAR